MLKLITSIPKDKLLHAFLCSIIVLYAVTFLRFGLSYLWAMILGNVVTIGIFLGKEYYDYRHPDEHSCEWKDILADFIGLLIVDIGLILQMI